MLQIYIHGDAESGFLELAPDTTLELESLQESFDEDITLGEFSLPIDVDWTENNRRILNFSERVENFKRTDNFFICTVYHQNFPELIRAKFTILGKKGNFNYRKGKFSASISGSKGLYGSAIKNKKMTDMVLGGTIEWAGMDSRQFAQSHATGGQPAYPYINFVPVAIQQFFVQDRKDYSGEFLAKDVVNNVITFGTGVNDFVFGRPDPNNENIAMAPGQDGYQDYRTVPFFNLQYVLKSCFTEFGYQVTGDLVEDAEFAKLVIFNNYGIENMNGIHQDENRRILPANHVPDILVGDWLKALFTLNSMFPVFMDSNQVRLVYHKTDVAVQQVTNLDGFIDGEFESQTLDGNTTENGYKISWSWDGEDSYYSERVKDLKDKNLVATVATRADLDVLNIGRTLTTDDIALVHAENMFYQVANATQSPVLWDAFAENMDEYINGQGEKAVTINMSTLCQFVELDVNSQLFVRKNYLGCQQKGSYINNIGVLVKNPFGNRVFYAGREQVGSAALKLPISYNHNISPIGVTRCKYSLAINGTAGLSSFHIPWLTITENAELVKVTAASSPVLLNNLRSYNRFQIAGTLFYLKQIDRAIPPKATLTLELVAL